MKQLLWKISVWVSVSWCFGNVPVWQPKVETAASLKPLTRKRSLRVDYCRWWWLNVRWDASFERRHVDFYALIKRKDGYDCEEDVKMIKNCSARFGKCAVVNKCRLKSYQSVSWDFCHTLMRYFYSQWKQSMDPYGMNSDCLISYHLKRRHVLVCLFESRCVWPVSSSVPSATAPRWWWMCSRSDVLHPLINTLPFTLPFIPKNGWFNSNPI